MTDHTVVSREEWQATREESLQREKDVTSTSEAWEEIVAESAPGGASDFNTKMIEEFRANEDASAGHGPTPC